MIKYSKLLHVFYFLFVLALCAFSDVSRTIPIFYLMAIMYAGIISLFCIRIKKINFHVNITLFAIGFFILWMVMSAAWQHSSAYYQRQVTTVIQTYIFMFLTALWIKDMKSLETAYKLLVAANVLNSLYRIVLHITANSVVDMLTGKNAVAVQMTMNYMIAIYLFYCSKEKKYIAAAILFMGIALMTGSRKATIGLIASTILIVGVHADNKKRWKSIGGMFILLLVGYWAFTHLEIFALANSRLQMMLNSYKGEGADSSTVIRAVMRREGFRAFMQNPLLGKGVGYSYTVINPSIGMGHTYLHNNYIEVGASLGIVGLIFFYIPHMSMVFISGRRLLDNDGFLMIFTVTMIMLLMDYGMVSYCDKFTLFSLNLLAIHSHLLRKERYNDREKK